MGLAVPHSVRSPDSLSPPVPTACATKARAFSLPCDPPAPAPGAASSALRVAGPLRPGRSRKEARWRLTIYTSLSRPDDGPLAGEKLLFIPTDTPSRDVAAAMFSLSRETPTS